MRQTTFLFFYILLVFAIGFTSCKDSKDELESGIVQPESVTGKSLEINTKSTLPLTFSAIGDWTATSSSSWCKMNIKSGSQGSNTIQLSVDNNSTSDRSSTITIEVKGYTPTTFKITQKGSSESMTEDMNVNHKVYNYLCEYYLWNDEYKALSLDFTKGYESFLNDALMSLNTNTLDKKINSNGSYSLFSYIVKDNKVSRSRSAKLVEKELEYSFGITGLLFLNFTDTNEFYFIVQGVYPDSPASRAGITRGTYIGKINGKTLNGSSSSEYYNLIMPDNVNTITVTTKENVDISIQSEAMYCNPVITSKVEKGYDGHTIGYMVYDNFNAAFDQELFDAFKNFKKEGVTDLIVDLRYNGGGHMISANMMASCIAGEYCNGKVFASLRFNDERMKQLNNKRENDMFSYSSYSNLGTSLSQGGLGLKKVYFIVGNGTASSSELTINSLKGIDIDAVLIGKTTTGKNVGMESTELTTTNNTYRLYPISFQSYNAKGFGDYEKGFEPNQGMSINENDPTNTTRYYNYVEYGNIDDPLYAKAIEDITGVKSNIASRSASSAPIARIITMPDVHKPGFNTILR